MDEQPVPPATCFYSWLADGLTDWEVDAAQAELARRWLARFGPATVTDVKWWTGWTMGETRKALAAAGAVDVELEGGAGLALPDDLEPVPSPEPCAALLPGLDPTPMGWKERDWYLGEHGRLLFDNAGNIGPNYLVGRSDRRRLGAAQRRRGRLPAARGRRLRPRRRGRGGREAADRAVRPDARGDALSDAARTRALRVELIFRAQISVGRLLRKPARAVSG